MTMAMVVAVRAVVVEFFDGGGGGGTMTPISCILLVGVFKTDKKKYAYSIQVILKICT